MQPKNIQTLIQEMLDRKRRKDEKLGLKRMRDAADEATEEQQLKEDSMKSYFTLSQYNAISKRISQAHGRMKEQQVLIDRLDRAVHGGVVKIRDRHKNRGGSSSLSLQ